MRTVLAVALALAALVPSAAASPTGFAETFDGAAPLADWTVTPGALWHVGACFSSGSSALEFTVAPQCHYDTGNAEFGNAVSPSIVLPAGPSALSFLSYPSTEYPESGKTCGERDNLELLLERDAGPTVRLYRECGELQAENTWWLRSFDLSPYAGETVRLNFQFDSGDEYENHYGGWAIDAISIMDGAPTPPVPELPAVTLALAGVGALVAFGLLRRKD